MNICAAVAPIIGAFSATGGPPGMLVGAIFSVIGQIIALFQPAQESDVDKIKAFLLSYRGAEGIERNMPKPTSLPSGLPRKACETTLGGR